MYNINMSVVFAEIRITLQAEPLFEDNVSIEAKCEIFGIGQFFFY